VNTTINIQYTTGNAGIPGNARLSKIGTPTAVAVYRSQYLYVADTVFRVLRVTLSTGYIQVYFTTSSKSFVIIIC
jgi:hypothetical protein